MPKRRYGGNFIELNESETKEWLRKHKLTADQQDEMELKILKKMAQEENSEWPSSSISMAPMMPGPQTVSWIEDGVPWAFDREALLRWAAHMYSVGKTPENPLTRKPLKQEIINDLRFQVDVVDETDELAKFKDAIEEALNDPDWDGSDVYFNFYAMFDGDEEGKLMYRPHHRNGDDAFETLSRLLYCGGKPVVDIDVFDGGVTVVLNYVGLTPEQQELVRQCLQNKDMEPRRRRRR